MTLEDEQRIPSDAAEWHPPEEEPEPEKIPAAQELETQHNVPEETKNLPALPAEKVRPTAKNPIEKVTVGLWHTLGHYDAPTRIILTLKDGSTAEMPWEQAEPLLPPEFRTARELGQSARQIELKITHLMIAIRQETYVMQGSGGLKGGLRRLVGMEHRPLQYLNTLAELTNEVDKVAQESFLELRQMADIHGTYQNKIPELASRLNLCQQKLDEILANISGDLPKIQDTYNLYQRELLDRKSLRGDSRPELLEPE